MNSVNFENQIIPYTIKRRRRKRSISLYVKPTLEVIVSANHSLPKEKIDLFVREKNSWIVKRQDYFRRRFKDFPPHKYLDGEIFLFLGEKYILDIFPFSAEDVASCQIYKNYIIVQLGKDNEKLTEQELVKKILKKWYLKQAKELISQRSSHYISLINIYPKKITIKNQKSCWGSCSPKGNINFNWRIIMAPMNVIDYLIVHELCHMKEMNHSNKFWNLVAKLIPDYKKSEEWLKKYGDVLIHNYD